MSSHLLLLVYIVFYVVLHRGLGTVNFALHKSAVQSSTLNYNFEWTADKAVDGNNDGSNPNRIETCSSTDNTYEHHVNHTWEVNITQVIIVKTVTVYGRTDGQDHLGGVKLFIGNVSMPWRYTQQVPSSISSKEKYVFNPTNTVGSFISLMRFGSIFVICEVTIEGECLGGNVTEFCNLTCGKCFADQPCNQDNGTCPLGCDAGRKGAFCKEDCERGNYGYNCNETCGNCLYGYTSCSITDKKCSSGCIAGWHGLQCNIGCGTGEYGYNCKETCGHCLYGNNSCDTSYGHCNNGCMAGWQGYDCKTKCDAGTYGFTCNETCGYCLNGNNTCLSMNGHCKDGCQAGWMGETCKSDCERGHYGYNCNETCGHCLYGISNCSTTDGNCTNGCIDGWHGYQCKPGTLGIVNADDAGPNCGVITGSVLAALGVCIFAMAIIIVIVKNKRKNNKKETSTEHVTPAEHYANLVVGSPNAACTINDLSRAEKDTTFSAIEETRRQGGLPIRATNCHSCVMEPDVPAYKEYEKLRYVPESTESTYYTIDHTLIDDQIMESMKNCSTFVETLHGLENALKSVEKEISVLLSKKETLFSNELKGARTTHLGDKLKGKDSHKDKDITIVNYVQMLQSVENEVRIFEEKRKSLLGRKEILLREELAKTTESEK